MQDNLSLVKRIINEHQTVKEHIKLAGDSVTDQGALASLQGAHTDFIPGRLEAISEKYKKLWQTVSYLEEGLRNHFDFEEKALPPLLGEMLTQALTLEHSEINREITKAKSIIAGISLEGLSREEYLAKDSYIEQVVDSLCQLIEEHATREEAVLEMLHRALEKQSQ